MSLVALLRNPENKSLDDLCLVPPLQLNEEEPVHGQLCELETGQHSQLNLTLDHEKEDCLLVLPYRRYCEAERHLHTVDHAVLIGEPLPEQDLKFLALHLLGDLPHPAMQLSITNNDFYSRMYYLEILAEGHADGDQVLATDILAAASHLATLWQTLLFDAGPARTCTFGVLAVDTHEAIEVVADTSLGELLAVELVARLLPYFEHELPLHNFTTSHLATCLDFFMYHDIP